MNTKLGIKTEQSTSAAEVLQKVLANEFVLYTKTRKAHWNIECNDFYSMHTFFELQYKELEQYIDDVAERIRTIGHYPIATLKEFSSITSLTEESRSRNGKMELLGELLNDHETIIKELRSQIYEDNVVLDAGTSDFITSLMGKHEKTAWIMRSHLK